MNEIPFCDSLKSNNVRSYNYNPGGPLLNSKPLKLPLHWVFHYATPATLLAQPGGIFMNFNKKQILTFCYVSWRRLRQPQTWGNVWLASGGPRTSTVPSACSAPMSVSQGDKLSSFLTFQQRWLGVETCKKIITTWITRQIWGIWKLRPAYSPETPNLGQNRWCFVPCDLEIWWMTLENNRASLLCCFKLCATFHSHWWIQTGVTVRKCPIWVKFYDF